MARTRDYDDAPPKVKSDAYVGILLLSLLAQIAGAVFLFLDWNQYPEKAPPKYAPPAATSPAAPAAPGGGQPVAPPAGQPAPPPPAGAPMPKQ